MLKEESFLNVGYKLPIEHSVLNWSSLHMNMTKWWTCIFRYYFYCDCPGRPCKGQNKPATKCSNNPRSIASIYIFIRNSTISSLSQLIACTTQKNLQIMEWTMHQWAHILTWWCAYNHSCNITALNIHVPYTCLFNQ